MTPRPNPIQIESDALVSNVRLRGQRRQRWLREGEPSVARRLAQIGVLGWIIVTPMLIGVFVGRWLDRTFDSGIFWTAPLLMLGLALGVLVGMEMDATPMSAVRANPRRRSPPFVALSAHLAAGLALGVAYVLAIWKSARLLGEGGSALPSCFLTAARLALLAAIADPGEPRGRRRRCWRWRSAC